MAEDVHAAVHAVKADRRQHNVRCPAHDDGRASLSVGLGADGRILLHCHAGCAFDRIVEASGLTPADLSGRISGPPQPSLVAAYDYCDEAGALLFQVCRFSPKDFRQRRPDLLGGWTWKLGDVRRVLYRMPQLRNQDRVFVVEGERDVDALWAEGVAATTCPGGAGKWRPEFSQQLVTAGVRSVVVIPDNDTPGQEHAEAVAEACKAVGITVRLLRLPGLPPKGDVSDWLATNGTAVELLALVEGAPADALQTSYHDVQPRTLASALETFRRWLYLDDPSALFAIAATLVANRAPGDPVWLLVVCAPSTGKTEILNSALGLPWVISAAKVTEASLLSGTPRKERAAGATGGLLRQIGDFGVLLVKDFTSVLAQNRDARAEAMAALREVYDGEWHRPVGTDGGRVLTWKGKCGLVGGVTPALDQYGAVTSALGDRFLLLRLPDADVQHAGAAALRHGDQERQMRDELRQAMCGLVEHADRSRVNQAVTDTERDRLIGLAAFTARTRTAVVRDGYTHSVTFLPQVEGPGRLVKAFARLLGGLRAIGCDEAVTWDTLTRIAIDCAPALRMRVIRELANRDEPARTSDIAEAIETTTKTAALYLEDLSILRLADRSKSGVAVNSPDMWAASAWLRDHRHLLKVGTKCTPLHIEHENEVGYTTTHISTSRTCFPTPSGPIDIAQQSQPDESLCPACGRDSCEDTWACLRGRSTTVRDIDDILGQPESFSVERIQ